MNHDPLCEGGDCTCTIDQMQDGHRIGCPFEDCNCDVIARVRNDERQKTFDADWSEMGQLAAVRLFRGQAYAAALRDAVEAVNNQRSKFKARDWDDAIDAVVAAIESLGYSDKQNPSEKSDRSER